MSGCAGDPFAAAHSVAEAVLYEGYLLYPYRASSPKNQVRWQFGVLTPGSVSRRDPSERASMRAECLVRRREASALRVRLRCLQLQHRWVESACEAGSSASADPGASWAPVEELEVDGVVHVEWDEAVEATVDLPVLMVGALANSGHREPFTLDEGTATEVVRSADGALAGRILRRREPVAGRVTVTAAPVPGPSDVTKVAVTIENRSPWGRPGACRDEVLRHSLVATHVMLALDDGAFLSLLDPPETARAAAADCHSDGAFPVLVGDDDNVVLASPIILYDHPAVAPESPGDLYDATEIDEILALRVLTLTDEEKAEARRTDLRAAAIVDRCDEMTPEAFDRLHGTMREVGVIGSTAGSGPEPLIADASGLTPGTQGAAWWDPEVDASVDPWSDSVRIAGVAVGAGTRVRLRPSRRADAQDLFLAGLTATVAGVFTDVEGNEHVAVSVEDDPAAEALDWQGRYLFFHPEEIEPLRREEWSR